MTAPNKRFVDGKKFMWDGRIYATEDDAATARDAYQRDGFETCTWEEAGAFLVYTRRVVKQSTGEQAH